ncbi:hypothetical protein HDV00_010872 [Rhizophlyctis rosea]|nr:hypothetical protein HDV00_010872 [Rhizophlyctis rosea]
MGIVNSCMKRNRSGGDFKYKDGRRYDVNFDPLVPGINKKDLVYPMPNDEDEMDRLDIQHYMLRYAYQGNYCAPVTDMLCKRGARILDAGCGSGIWAIEMATDFPNAAVTGIDISPVQSRANKPPNVEFQTVDLTKLPLPFADGTFDFVRMRFLILGIKADQWASIIRELARVTKKGGYMELCEPTMGVHEDQKVMQEFMANVAPLIAARGVDTQIASKLKSHLLNCDLLTNVRETSRLIPYRRFPEDEGLDRLAELVRHDAIMAQAAMKPVFVARGMPPEQFDDTIRRATEEMAHSKGGMRSHVVWGMRI